MALTPGDRLGPYEVLARIGEGGMGQVFRARDTRLNRIVAIKILASRLTEDEKSRQRFQREAQTISSLSHPNICTLFDVGDHHGTQYLVMEYVEGATLAQRIAKGPLPLTEALTYAVQILCALDHAHRKGVLHRDLKPANIMLSGAGSNLSVKLLDFGLAKALTSAEPSTSDKTELAITDAGAIVGTPQYMPPEVLHGQHSTSRSDLHAFGAILYEMLTGTKAFHADSKGNVLAAVVRDQPQPVSSLRPDVPPALEAIIRRCLAKDPEERWQTAADLLAAIQLINIPSGSVPSTPGQSTRLLGRLVWVVLALLAGIVIGVNLFQTARPDLSSYRLTPLITEAGRESGPSWSPDGRTLAYVGESDTVQQIFTRSIDAAASTRITRMASACMLPFWSPDGGRIYYVSESKLWSVSAAGGAPQLVLKEANGATISPDGNSLAFTKGAVGAARLWIRSPMTAEPRLFELAPFSDPLASISPPQFSPDGSKIAVSIARRAGAAQPELWILPYPSGEPRRVVSQLPWGVFTIRRFSWMPDSRHIAYSGEGRSGEGRMYRIDTESGHIEALTATTAEETDPAVSPDGKRIAFATGNEDHDVVEMSIQGKRIGTLQATSRNEQRPAWSPSGLQFSFVTNANGPSEIWLRSSDDAPPRPLVRTDPAIKWNRLDRPRFSPDGTRIAFDVYGDKHVIAISSLAGGSPIILDRASADQHGPSWSPDGGWIAYRRLYKGNWELVKAPVGGGEPVSLGETSAFGGSETDWSPDGNWICHLRGSLLYLVAADGKSSKNLNTRSTAFGFARDSSTVYVVRRRAGSREWELAQIAVADGKEKSVSLLDVPTSASIAGFSLHPGGTRFATSIGFGRFDIWLLDGIPNSGSSWRWPFRKSG